MQYNSARIVKVKSNRIGDDMCCFIIIVLPVLLHKHYDVTAAGDAQWQQRVAGRLQQLRCVAKAVATFGGRQAVSAGEAEQDPMLHALAATKKHLDALETDLVRTEDDLARTRHKLQVKLLLCVNHAQLHMSSGWNSHCRLIPQCMLCQAVYENDVFVPLPAW